LYVAAILTSVSVFISKSIHYFIKFVNKNVLWSIYEFNLSIDKFRI
jgi:hypothetical protein